jgi:hypothetical protein
MELPGIEITRRDLLCASVLAVEEAALGKPEHGPWYQDLRRAAFHNLNEYDPQVLDVESWMEYWASLHPQVFVTSCAGLMAFYPTRLPHHPRSQFLGDRDVFGEYLRAARKRGMRVIARIETNWAHRDVLEARPEWFERDENGNAIAQAECPWIYHTCMFSEFYAQQVTAIMQEVSALYDVDGFFTNSWPDAGKPRRCYCAACTTAGANSANAYERHEERVYEICRSLQVVAGETRSDRVYAIHIGNGIRSVLSLEKLARLAPLLIADHQGRTDDTPIWDCAQQGRAAKACTGSRPVALGVGTSGGVWRHTAKAPEELTSWMAQAVASGMAPRYTWLGSMQHDRRWQQTGQDFFGWLARHEKHLTNRRTIANIGVVFSQRTNGRYHPPKSVRWGYDTLATDPEGSSGEASNSMQGLYYALLDGRFVFDFVHEDRLSREVLDRYSTLLLPNVALLSDAQCRELHGYVERGGSLLATFETGLYDEKGAARAQSGLADLFEMRGTGTRAARVDAYFYTRRERSHELLSGFESSPWLPGGEHRVPVLPVTDPVLTVINSYPQGIPEMVYAHARRERPYRGPETTEPAVIVAERGRSRLVYFPGDIDRCAWQTGNTDFLHLLQNAVRWLTRNESPVKVTGKGTAEVFAWETEAGYALHVLNYNHPNMTRASMRTPQPIGMQNVRLDVPPGVRIGSVELLRCGQTANHRQSGGSVEFTIPSVLDYEIAALQRES